MDGLSSPLSVQNSPSGERSDVLKESPLIPRHQCGESIKSYRLLRIYSWCCLSGEFQKFFTESQFKMA